MKRFCCCSFVLSCLLALSSFAMPLRAAPGVVTAKTYDHSLDGPLSEAIVANKTDQVASLLKRGADPQAKTPDDTATPLLCLAAATEGATDIARLLVEAGADLEIGNVRGDAPLVAAALRGNVEAARFLLKAGANIEAGQDGGRTSLMFAAATGHTEVVRVLIGAGAKVNARANDGSTPLIFNSTKTSAGSGNLAIAKLLVEAGADVSPEVGGNNAITLARNNNLNDIAEYLDTVRIRDEALLQAAAQGDWDAIKAALAQGANPRYQTTLFDGEGDDTGRTMTAAMWLRSTTPGFDEAVAAQILSLSDVEAHETDGDTGLILAILNRDFVMVHLFLKAGANPNVIQHATGESPLMLAAEIGNLTFVKMLVTSGAVKETRTPKGETAFSLASGPEKDAIIQFLQNAGTGAPGQKATADDDLPDLSTVLAPSKPTPAADK